MDLEALLADLTARPGAVEEHPFGPQPQVFKIGGRIFALVAADSTPPRVSLKCDPAHAQFLREAFPAVQPGYHLNKEHWNTITLDGSIPAEGMRELVDESYRLVLAKLPKAQRRFLTGDAQP